MQIAPTVNIVLSYEAEAMMSFKELGTFEAFATYQEAKDADSLKELGENFVPNTYLFNNSPNSTFLSLNHQFSKDDTKLEVEIIDPQGVFEKAMLDNTLQGQVSMRNDMVASRLQDLLEKKLFQTSKKHRLKEERRILKNNSNPSLSDISKLDASIATLQDSMEAVEDEIEDIQDLSSYDKSAKNAAALQHELNAQTSQMQRPIYVTYGIGNNFKDWAPVQCFGSIIKIEYSFTGTGARILKLKFNGKSMHPNLMKGFGVNPLGAAFTKGLKSTGTSYRIFNEEAAKAEAHAFIRENKDFILIPGGSGAVQHPMGDAIEKYLGDAMNPSFHLCVTSALTELIKQSTNYENVLVLMPNLDKWLAGYLEECLDGCTWYSPFTFWYNDNEANEKLGIKMRGWQEALEGIGMKLVEVPDDSVYSAAVGSNTYEYLEECDAVEDLERWMNNRHFKVMVECDFGEQTFLEKITEVGKAIQEKIEDYNEDPISVSFMNQISVETDFEMLQILRKHSLIPRATTPLVFWGDAKMRDSILYARLLESNKGAIHAAKLKSAEQAGDDDLVDELQEKGVQDISSNDLTNFVSVTLGDLVHPLDILDGFNVEYMNDVLDYVIPSESWIGAFGPMYQGDDGNSMALPNDTNISNSLGTMKGNQPKLAARLPVFSFGTTSPNITGIDIDINGQYVAAMNSAGPVGMPGQGSVQGIIPKGFEGQTTIMFRNMESLDLTDIVDGIPRGFKPLVKPFYDSDWYNNDNVQNFEEWGKVFNNLGSDAYKDMGDKTFGGSEAEEDFYRFMWQAFQALYSKTTGAPLASKSNPSKNPGSKFITNSVAVTSKISGSALKGSITTLPMFSLSTDRRVMNRACLLYCIEPQFTTSKKDSAEPEGNSTWYSGVYNMHGFTHVISSGGVSSKFQISRPGTSGLVAKEKGFIGKMTDKLGKAIGIPGT